MKISRNKIQSCNEPMGDDIRTCNEEVVCDETAPVASPQLEAKDLIRQAIDKLAQVTKEDDVAKDAIADLSVVLFEL